LKDRTAADPPEKYLHAFTAGVFSGYHLKKLTPKLKLKRIASDKGVVTHVNPRTPAGLWTYP
jgi:hypothetical protein